MKDHRLFLFSVYKDMAISMKQWKERLGKEKACILSSVQSQWFDVEYISGPGRRTQMSISADRVYYF
jgi:hypothetical protein